MIPYEYEERYYTKGEDYAYYQEHPSESISILEKAASGPYEELRGRAHFTLGMIFYEKDPARAEREFESAIKEGDESAYLYAGVLKLKRGSSSGIEDICCMLSPGEFQADKAAEALYIIRKWLKRNGEGQVLAVLNERLGQLWDNTSPYVRSKGRSTLRKAYMALYDLIPKEDEAVLFPNGKPTGKAGEAARADLFRYFQKIAYENGENFGSGVVERTIANANLAELDAYVSGLRGEGLDLTDRYTGWEDPEKNKKGFFAKFISTFPTFMILAVVVTVLYTIPSFLFVYISESSYTSFSEIAAYQFGQSKSVFLVAAGIGLAISILSSF